MTREERFPKIFDAALKLKPDAKRILSFGCSTGEETFAIAKRFPNAEIIGIDIDHYNISDARLKNKNPNIFFHDEIGGTGTYDLVFVLMVLFSMENPINKQDWYNTLKLIHNHINPGGVLIIYTSDHDPNEVLNKSYDIINSWPREHNVNKKTYFNGYYRKK
ncbi:MAG: methyltransferase domain-containing protein [Elusimicrobia bacterium]|nr:methyltransferase domain-containing protein [Elusimicrobiota bacterium]